MLRSALSVLAGFVAWSVLWVGIGVAVRAAAAEQFNEDGSTSVTGLLVIFLAASVVLSVLAGWLTARLARRSPMQHGLALGVVLLLVGVAVEASSWNLAPTWYHIVFLILLVPMALAGAKLSTGWRNDWLRDGSVRPGRARRNSREPG